MSQPYNRRRGLRRPRESRGLSDVQLSLVCVCTGLVLLAVLIAGTPPKDRAGPAATTAHSPPAKDPLFDPTRVWTAHLRFEADQWEAMEPQGGFGPPGLPPGPPGAFGPGGPPPPAGAFGPGAFGPGGPPPGEFGPGMFVAPVFIAQGDADGDQRLSEEELLSLGRRWFDQWDAEGAGVLDMASIRKGLNTAMAPPAGPGPPGGVGAPHQMPRMNFRGPEGKRNGVLAVMGIDFPSVRAELEFDDRTLPDVSVRYKGNGTFLQLRSTLKRSLKVDLNKGFPGRKLHGVTKLNFHNNVTDASWMNEVLSYRLFRDAGVPAPRTAYARVYVTVPGKYEREYLGLYSLVENLDNSFARRQFGTKKGVLFKPVATEIFTDMGDDWSAYRQAYDPKTAGSEEETSRVIAFCKLVSHADDAEFVPRLDEFLDLDAFARFMAVTTWLSTFDSLLAMSQNYVVYLHPRTHKFQFLPWDLDHSFGQFYPIGTQEQRENLSIHQPWAGANRFLERVFQVDAFKRRYLADLEELNATLCRPEQIGRAHV